MTTRSACGTCSTLAARPFNFRRADRAATWIPTDLFQLAMVRLVEIIGEAASRLSKETHAASANIPWPQIISTCNRLIHGYDQIDHDILWNILTQDLPPLIPALDDILSKS